MRQSSRIVVARVVAAAVLSTATACSPSAGAPATAPGPTRVPVTASPTTTTRVAPPTTTFDVGSGFDDHTVARLQSVEQVTARARPGVGGQLAVKFTIPDLSGTEVRWMDSNFYTLHDEWYWFRLLNGQTVPGVAVAPVRGRRFSSIAEVFRWASTVPAGQLPLDLELSTHNGATRLYSPAFYDLVLNVHPKVYGVGSLIRMPIVDASRGSSDEVAWLIELEFSDDVSSSDVARFFDVLIPTLPTDIGQSLKWVIRSPAQQRTADEMIRGSLPYADRIVHFSDFVEPGTVQVYSEGLTAGRLLYVGDDGADLSSATSDDIIITAHAPDYLPAARAIITSDPQTPLAHVSILARNRGMPNASRAGITDDPNVRQAARVRTYAIVDTRNGALRIALISREEYQQWAALAAPTTAAVPAVDVAQLPFVVDLASAAESGVTAAQLDAWRLTLGGKSVGMMVLLATPDVETPPDPLAITIRPYVEHVASLLPTITAVLADPEFTASARARVLFLEGRGRFDELFGGLDNGRYADALIAGRPSGSLVGDVLAAGGVRAVIESKPINPDTLAAIMAVLASAYDDYDVTTGLRFRSSSTVEDIAGFNGAGLYASHTGFLQPEFADDPDDQYKTVERAMLRTWSSYWTFEAFEERRLYAIDHFSGAMGVTVHARFDDDKERNNGVATVTLLGAANSTKVDINVQPGPTPVTNPDATANALPEVIQVSMTSSGVDINRVARSSAASGHVLSDAAVTELVTHLHNVALHWPANTTLDVEFKTVEAGWPLLEEPNAQYPPRLILRQVRAVSDGAAVSAEATEYLESRLASPEVFVIVR